MNNLINEAKILLQSKQMCKNCNHLLEIDHLNGSYVLKCKYYEYDHFVKERREVRSTDTCEQWRFNETFR
jgi:hypothetical protein